VAEVGLEESDILTQQGFGRRMSARFAKAKVNGRIRYHGIGLRREIALVPEPEGEDKGG